MPFISNTHATTLVKLRNVLAVPEVMTSPTAATVQMPAGIPVASVAIGKAGAKNAAYLAAQILSVADPAMAGKLRDERAANAEAIRVKDQALQESLKG